MVNVFATRGDACLLTPEMFEKRGFRAAEDGFASFTVDGHGLCFYVERITPPYDYISPEIWYEITMEGEKFCVDWHPFDTTEEEMFEIFFSMVANCLLRKGEKGKAIVTSIDKMMMERTIKK